MKRLKVLLLAITVISSLAGCVTSSDKVVCPLNYDVSQDDCKLSDGTYDSYKYEEVSAVGLQQNQVGIYTPPGNRPVQLVKGIGYHAIPAKYTYVYPTDERVVKTERDMANIAKCSDLMVSYGECNTPIDNVAFLGGTLGVVEMDLTFALVINEATAKELAEIGPYSKLVGNLWDFMRPKFRQVGNIDSEVVKGNYQLLSDRYKEDLTTWRYYHLLDVKDIQVRSITGPGFDDTSFNVELRQADQSAASFATQEWIACGHYPDARERNTCMTNYIHMKHGTSPGQFIIPSAAESAPAPAAPTAPAAPSAQPD